MYLTLYRKTPIRSASVEVSDVQQLKLMMQKFEELQRQLSYPRDDIPVSVEPDASQV